MANPLDNTSRNVLFYTMNTQNNGQLKIFENTNYVPGGNKVEGGYF